MATIFQGTIFHAWMDAQATPDVAFRVEAQAGLVEAMKPIAPTSVQGSGDTATIMGQLAKTMGLNFENNNVNVKLSNPYFHGTGRTQALHLAEAAGIEWIIDNGKLAIWNKGQARSGAATMVSKDTIMVGYPGLTQWGVVVKTLFDPTLTYGGQIQVQSDITPACGMWIIYALEYDLASMMPHGPWFCLISACSPNQAPPVS